MSVSQRQVSVADGQSGTIITNVRIKADADELGVTITNPGVEFPQIMEVVEAEITNLTKTMTLDERTIKVMSAITERLRTDGFVVEEMPVGDLTMNFEFSLNSGIFVGRAQHMLSNVSSDQSQLPRDIHKA